MAEESAELSLENSGLPDIPSGIDEDLADFEPLENPTTTDSSSESEARVAELENEIALMRERVRIVEAFEQDPVGTIERAAKELGMSVGPSESSGQGANRNSSQPDADFVAAYKEELTPEMQFMGDQMAKASWTAIQRVLEPLKEQLREQSNSVRVQERDRHAAEMDRKHPDWRNVQGEMAELYNFLKGAFDGGPMASPRFGSAQEVLYKLIAGDGRATTEAASRMRDAAQNVSSRSDSAQPTQVNVDKLIDEAESFDDKLKIAMRAALQSNGVT